MSKYNYAPGAIHIDHHKDLNIDVKSVDDAIRLMSAFMSDRTEDIVDVSPSETIESADSIIFTKKAKNEGKITTIIEAFKRALSSRRDKSRALAQEVKIWQEDEYVDAHYNARVMYDELAKIIHLPFGYEAFKQHYNHTRY